MIRTGTILLTLAALALPAAAQAGDAPATPFLKRDVTVSGELVRIGDFIENAGPAATVAIFRAPDPGETGRVPVKQILDAVRPHLAAAVDTGEIADVSVTRTGRAFGQKEIEAVIAGGVAARNLATDIENLTVTFDREIPTLHSDAAGTTEPHLARFGYDPRSGRFDAAITIPGQRLPLRLTGIAVETTEVPVLVRPLNRGDLVKASDLTTERRRRSDVGNDAVTADNLAIGRAARRPLRANQVLRIADLMKPEVIQRNDNITIFFEAPGILLTARGKALDSGADGDVINVTNVQSKRNVQATIVGPGRVIVSVAQRSFGTVAAATTASQSE